MTQNPPDTIMAGSAQSAAASKRFHVHLSVQDLDANIRFYSALFGADPTVTKTDYAKWMLDDPRINFAISTRGEAVGIEHLGIQVDTDAALTALRDQAAAADLATVAELGSACCYAKSDKYWLEDPQGVAWETFNSLEGIPTFSGAEQDTNVAKSTADNCCLPKVPVCRPNSGCC